eukprot:3442253-Karenia_brevis.AAC.1
MLEGGDGGGRRNPGDMVYKAAHWHVVDGWPPLPPWPDGQGEEKHGKEMATDVSPGQMMCPKLLSYPNLPTHPAL